MDLRYECDTWHISFSVVHNIMWSKTRSRSNRVIKDRFKVVAKSKYNLEISIWRSEICFLTYYWFYLTCGFILFWHILRMLIVFSPWLFFLKIWKFHDTRLAVISLLLNVERKVSPFWKACLIRITKKSPENQNGDFPPFFFFVYKNLSKKWVFSLLGKFWPH